MSAFKAILPVKSGRDLIKVLGVDKSMDSFVGPRKTK